MRKKPFDNRLVNRFSLTVFLICGTTAHAGGVYVGDVGGRAMGRSGAFAAKGDDLSAIEYNPAMLAVRDDTEIFLSNRFGYANEEFRRAPLWDYNGPLLIHADPVQNEKPWQLLMPILGAATDFGLKDWGFAIGAYAPPGISVQQFPLDGGQRYMLVERDFKILYYNLSAAWKFRDIFGIGASFQWVSMPSIKMSLVVNGDIASVVSPVSSLYDVKATINAADYVGASGVVGLWYRPWPFLQFALSGRIVPTHFNAEGTLKLETLGLEGTDVTTERDGESADDVTFSMSLPMMLRFGARYMHMKGDYELFDVELDFVYEAWQQVDEYVVDGDGMEAEVLGQWVDVGRIAIPKNWRGTYSARLGGDYNVLKDLLTLRLGGFYESAASQKPYTYVDILASHRLGASVGASVMFFGVDITLAYQYTFEFPVTVSEGESRIYQQVPGSPCEAPYTDPDPNTCDPSYLGQPSASANAGTYINHYHFLSVALSYSF